MPQRRDAKWLMEAAPELVPLRPASEVAGMDMRTLAKLVEAGDLPSVKTERRTLIPRQALLDMLHLTRAGAAV